MSATGRADLDLDLTVGGTLYLADILARWTRPYAAELHQVGAPAAKVVP
jgi:hypothetical protein